jgi:2,3-bisphosphoglycerate-independent phosphoglycerate mutase
MDGKPRSRGGREMAAAVKEQYAAGQTDYALEPLVLVDEKGVPLGRVADGDAVIFCCRRGDREVELTEAFTEVDFPHFERPSFNRLNFIILTLYHEKFKDLPVAFAPSKIPDTLGEVASRAGLRQLHTAESEKFAHVTFFFNGGNNAPFTGEDDRRIPSPRGIPFERVPGLSLEGVVAQVLDGISAGYHLVVVNFANGDVIGHTADTAAKIQCAEAVDDGLGRVLEAAIGAKYAILVTADHGNLEELLTPEGTPHVSHTANPVQFVVIDPLAPAGFMVNDGILADVAPTILAALGVEQPARMTGVNLIPRHDWQGNRKVLLLVLDGWGIGQENASNPIYLAQTPVWDGLLVRYPHSRLQASGEAVGLEPDKPGNSEAGHMNLGAGRVVQQDDVRLDQAMKDGSFYENEIFCQAIQEVKQAHARLHLFSLLTEKSSHGSIAYPLAILKMAREAGLDDVFVHVIFDGRSTEPGSAPALLEKLERQIEEIGVGTIATGIGRGIALDRDGNYAKIKRAFDALVHGTGRPVIFEEDR